MLQHSANDRERVTYGFQLVTGRQSTDPEASELLRLLATERNEFRENPATAESLAQVGESLAAADVNRCELAAWTVIGNLLLNLDEVLNRE
jgi:hypothetical protein